MMTKNTALRKGLIHLAQVLLLVVSWASNASEAAATANLTEGSSLEHNTTAATNATTTTTTNTSTFDNTSDDAGLMGEVASGIFLGDQTMTTSSQQQQAGEAFDPAVFWGVNGFIAFLLMSACSWCWLCGGMKFTASSRQRASDLTFRQRVEERQKKRQETPEQRHSKVTASLKRCQVTQIVTEADLILPGSSSTIDVHVQKELNLAKKLRRQTQKNHQQQQQQNHQVSSSSNNSVASTTVVSSSSSSSSSQQTREETATASSDKTCSNCVQGQQDTASVMDLTATADDIESQRNNSICNDCPHCTVNGDGKPEGQICETNSCTGCQTTEEKNIDLDSNYQTANDLSVQDLEMNSSVTTDDDENDDIDECEYGYVRIHFQTPNSDESEKNDLAEKNDITTADAEIQPKTRLVPNCCAICLGNYEVGETIVWSSNPLCCHAFHFECIVDWLVKVLAQQYEYHPGAATEGSSGVGTPCPCCRQEFTDLEETNSPKRKFAWVPRNNGGVNMNVNGMITFRASSHRQNSEE